MSLAGCCVFFVCTVSKNLMWTIFNYKFCLSREHFPLFSSKTATPFPQVSCKDGSIDFCMCSFFTTSCEQYPLLYLPVEFTSFSSFSTSSRSTVSLRIFRTMSALLSRTTRVLFWYDLLTVRRNLLRLHRFLIRVLTRGSAMRNMSASHVIIVLKTRNVSRFSLEYCLLESPLTMDSTDAPVRNNAKTELTRIGTRYCERTSTCWNVSHPFCLCAWSLIQGEGEGESCGCGCGSVGGGCGGFLDRWRWQRR